MALWRLSLPPPSASCHLTNRLPHSDGISSLCLPSSSSLTVFPSSNFPLRSSFLPQLPRRPFSTKSRGALPPQEMSRRPDTSCELPSLEKTEMSPIFSEPGRVADFPLAAGVYAIFDKEGVLQYMGLSRRLVASIHGHAEELPDLCATVKVAVVDAPNRDTLTAAWKSWMDEHIAAGGGVPPGNESGNTTWTARKVKRVKPDIKLTPGAHVELTVPITELIDKVVKECKVVAFIKGTRTSPECGFSHRLLTILNEARCDYETLNVLDENHNPGLRDAIKAYSQWPTVPQLYVKGEFLGGVDIMEEMLESGELKKALSV
eukprot:TRINITY_DN2006_c0_g2_i1.p1 TRINITY_DN2006_c0_g2~~TRINITY_DN2006_c0_g2_i1.p1  ORF type:complete len:318 (+),score=36.82 TRINITY_DN2006_c0_g2_i1:154-1107(+)